MSNRFPLTRASFWNGWRSPMSTKSLALLRQSLFAKRIKPAIRARRLPRRPNYTISCGLLWARAGRTYCPNDGTRIQSDTVDQVAEAMLARTRVDSRWYALFPVKSVRRRYEAAALRDRLFDLRQEASTVSFQRANTFEFSTPESLLGNRLRKTCLRPGRPSCDPARFAPAHRRYG